MTQRRAKGEGTLYRRKDGYWVAGVEIPTTDGRRRYKRRVRKDRNHAIAELKKLRAEVAAGHIPTTSSTTVARWLDHWLVNIHGPAVKPTTYRSYELSIRQYINPTLGSKRLDRLTPEDVRGMHRRLQETSTRNAQKAHTVLQKALKDAVNEGVVSRNVAEAVVKPKHVKTRRDPFTPSVAAHIIRTAESSSDEMWAARWMAGFTTGARQGELLGLEWDRVDLDNGIVDLSWQLQELQKVHGCKPVKETAETFNIAPKVKGTLYPCGKMRPSACPSARWDFPPGFEYREIERSLVLTRPKTSAGTRIVPILPPLVLALQRLQDDSRHGLVFHHTDGAPLSPDQDRRQWRALLEQAGVPHQPLHSMRNSVATILMAAGVDALIIQAILGHSDVLTTRIYQHVDLGLQRQAITALSGLLSGGTR